MADTNIEWADKTWNPVVGCTKISPGCDHCYAERMACRLASNPQTPQYQDVVSLDGKSWNGKTRLAESAPMQPLKWRKPCRIFVGSMTDLFHCETPDEWLDRIFAVMALCSQHTFLVLTKRPDGMREYFSGLVRHGKPDVERWDAARRPLYDACKVSAPNTAERIGYMGAFVKFPLPNVWLGVTAENQAMADYRIPILLDTPAAKRFVSYEPGLEAVNFERHFWPQRLWAQDQIAYAEKAHEYRNCTIPTLDWIITGSESGPGERPMDVEWARSLKDQCVDAGVPFFYKQGPGDDGRVVKMPVLDGRTWDQRPE